mgnify:FL=1
MGYRSEVKYVVSFKDPEQRAQFEQLVKHKGDEQLAQALDELDVCGRYLVARFDGVKWYPSYEDVQAHHKLMGYAREVFEDDAAWRFVRIGEEDNDIEVDSDDPNDDLWEILYPVRSIELNLSMPTTKGE